MVTTLCPHHEPIDDIGSGINFPRNGLQRILEGLLNVNIKELVVLHQDRLYRFGIDFFKPIFKPTKPGFLVHLPEEGPCGETELADGVLSIVNVFVARKNGRCASNR